MRIHFPAALLLLAVTYCSVTAFQCGSAEMTTARLAIDQKQYEKAEDALVKSLAKNDKDEEAWFLLGQVRLQLKKYEEMNEAYTRALAISDVHKSEITANRLAIWRNLYGEAADDYNKGRDNAEFYDMAITKLTLATRLNPDSLQTYYFSGLVYYQKKEYDKAVSHLNVVLEKNPNNVEALGLLVEIHLNRAVEQENAGNKSEAVAQYAKAADMLEKSFHLQPDKPDIIANLILALERSNQSAKALTITREAVAQNPENSSFHFAYGVYLLKQNEYEESVGQFRKARDLDSLNANYSYNCGAAYLNWGVAIKQEADKKLEANKGKDVKPDVSYREKFREALPYLKRSTELQSKDPVFWQSLAKAYTYLGMVKESEAAYKQFDRLTKEN